MGKILLENSTQKFEEVFLFGEAVSSDESFTSIETYFGEINCKYIKNGIKIGSSRLQRIIFYNWRIWSSHKVPVPVVFRGEQKYGFQTSRIAY